MYFFVVFFLIIQCAYFSANFQAVQKICNNCMYYRNSLEQKFIAIKQELGKVSMEIGPVLKILKYHITYLEPLSNQLKINYQDLLFPLLCMPPIQFRQDSPNIYREVAKNVKMLTDDEFRKHITIHVCHLSKLKCIV